MLGCLIMHYNYLDFKISVTFVIQLEFIVCMFVLWSTT